MQININEEQRLILLAAVDMYEGSEGASIKESVECAEIEEILRAAVTPDLLFIREHVKEWPEGAKTVRLDRDGEICFLTEQGDGRYDFSPSSFTERLFNCSFGDCGVGYTEQEWSA